MPNPGGTLTLPRTHSESKKTPAATRPHEVGQAEAPEHRVEADQDVELPAGGKPVADGDAIEGHMPLPARVQARHERLGRTGASRPRASRGSCAAGASRGGRSPPPTGPRCAPGPSRRSRRRSGPARGPCRAGSPRTRDSDPGCTRGRRRRVPAPRVERALVPGDVHQRLIDHHDRRDLRGAQLPLVVLRAAARDLLVDEADRPGEGIACERGSCWSEALPRAIAGGRRRTPSRAAGGARCGGCRR